MSSQTYVAADGTNGRVGQSLDQRAKGIRLEEGVRVRKHDDFGGDRGNSIVDCRDFPTSRKEFQEANARPELPDDRIGTVHRPV
jgi:hypothetical protein